MKKKEQLDRLLGSGWQGRLSSADRGFRCRLLSRDNLRRLEEIHRDLGDAPGDVLAFALGCRPVSARKAPRLADAEKHVAFLREKALPQLREILSTYVLGVIPTGDGRVAISPARTPAAAVGRPIGLMSNPRASELLEGIEDLATRLESQKKGICAPSGGERDETEAHFFERWERRASRLRRIVRELEGRVQQIRETYEEKASQIGAAQVSEADWDVLTKLAARKERTTRWLARISDALSKEERLRKSHGTGLFEVIFGRPLTADAYEKAVERYAVRQRVGDREGPLSLRNS